MRGSSSSMRGTPSCTQLRIAAHAAPPPPATRLPAAGFEAAPVPAVGYVAPETFGGAF